MKKILLTLLIINQIFAVDTNTINDYFNNKEYDKICNNQTKIFLDNSEDENLINIYGISCLFTNQIQKLQFPIRKLIKTKKSRENALYFADILFKKKMLYYAVIDDIDISYIKLPRSNYILSIIFDKFVKKEYTKEGNKYFFKGEDSETKYELEKVKSKIGIFKLILRKFENNKLVSYIEYW